MIRALLFDFYGVFIPDSYGTWLRRNGLKREGVLAELINQRDRNQLTESAFLDELSRHVGREVLPQDIHIRNPQPDTELIMLMNELKASYKISLLSNASTTLREKLQDYDLLSLFDKVFISSEIGFTKPDPKAYDIAVQGLGLKPEEILFIDDNKINTEAAARLRIETIEFVSTHDLRVELQQRRIL